MKNTLLISKKSGSLSFRIVQTTFIICLLSGFILPQHHTHATEADKVLMEFIRQQNISYRAEKIKEAQEIEIAATKSILENLKLHKILQKKFNEAITPGDRMRCFEQEIIRCRDRGMKIEEIFQNLHLLSKMIAATGSISGTVLENGEPVNWINVTAYDEFGYAVGSASSQWPDGYYTITNLPSGKYYVKTSGWLIDEFYDDIPADNNFDNFRQVLDGGHLVQVTEGADTPDIDFDLLRGAVITGMIYEADGVTPINLVENWPNFKLYRADSEIRIYASGTSYSSWGSYSLTLISLGDMKFSVSPDGYVEEFYNNKSDWQSADILTLTSFTDSLKNIDFSLDVGTAPPITDGAISGSVAGGGGVMPVVAAIVVAFNTADTSIAGFALASLLNAGAYIIPDLPAGSYWLYADDVAGNVLGLYNLVGEYYNNAPTPDLASPVTVVPDDTTENINFDLSTGGGIQGTVQNDAGTAIDSALVLAFNADLLNLEVELPLTSWLYSHMGEVWFDIDLTDGSGQYQMDGLPAGNYIVRTMTLIGPHAFTVFDEYYDNVQDILDIDQATPVSVAAMTPTTGINFSLDRSGSITGVVTDGSTPIGNVALFAIVDTTDFFATTIPGISDSTTGRYTIPMLHTDNYKVIAIPEADEEPFYLVEFYGGQFELDDAATVSVTTPSQTTGIDFTLDTGGFIQGIVYLSSGYQAGADTLSGFPVIAYDAATGRMAGVSAVTWSGGYRIGQLPTGSYNVAAMPAVHGYGVTYHGGGETFDDPLSTSVEVKKMDSTRADITMKPGNMTISGTVTLGATGLPLMSVVLSYDMTGHAVSFALSGSDRTTGATLATPGDYILYGIRDHLHYVRTWAFYGIYDLMLNTQNAGGLAKTACCGCGEPSLVQDEWYDDVRIDPHSDCRLFNIKRLRHTKMGKVDNSKLLYGYFPINKDLFPMYTKINPLAKPVFHMGKRSADSQILGITGIDFTLNYIGETDIRLPEITLLSEFQLEQNYPNPFNPETAIRYTLPYQSQVELLIFNLKGQKIAALVKDTQSKGQYEVHWNGLNEEGMEMPSGVYIYRIKTDRFIHSRKLTLIR